MMNTDFSRMYINGSWKTGSSETAMKNVNPFNGEELFAIQAATKEDLNEAYDAAEKAQTGMGKGTSTE